MKVRIILENAELLAHLENTAVAREFGEMLPLTLTLEDYHETEKIADLPSRLDTDDTPDGMDPDVGDITYFVPWGNLALFYRDFGYAKGLVRLGRVEGNVDILEGKGPLKARIELIDASE